MHYILRHPLLRFFVPVSGLIPIITGIKCYKHLSKSSKIILFYLIFGIITELIIGIMSSHHVSNLMLLPFYTIIEFVFFSSFFTQIFTGKRIIKMVKIIAVIFSIICLINVGFFQKINQFNTYTRSLEAFLLITYCLIYFDQESRTRQTLRWEKKPANWIVAGTLAYFAGAFFLFLFSNVINLHLSVPIQIMLWNVHGVILIIMNVLYAVGFLNERSSR